MSKRQLWFGLGIAVLLLVGFGFWGYGYVRHIDGRSPSQWLAYADQASHRIAYHAEGQSMTNGMRASFILDQGTDGRYMLTTRDAQGRRCSLGYDGSQLWYSSGSKQEKITVSRLPETPMPKHARIIGMATIAGRPVVKLAVNNGRQQKNLAIDRKTGIVLAMRTQIKRHVQSEMNIDRVEYRPVDVQACTMDCDTRAISVDRSTLATKLGGKVIEAQWLPEGFKLIDILLEPCSDCGQPMGVLRYSDGISAITLFEMSRHAIICDMGEGCHQAGSEHALVANTIIGDYSVTVVGTVNAPTMKKIMTHLR